MLVPSAASACWPPYIAQPCGKLVESCGELVRGRVQALAPLYRADAADLGRVGGPGEVESTPK
jgi:hypothetical protein